ncbi:MAG: hypothetical protein DMD70_06765 [Gemmatimonadetes bacterium]|nr:MAG: hypothetical protein DMD70_06765 [Gemmatimonadota bacterium]
MWKRVKNRVQGRVTRFRVPGGAAPAEADAHRQADPVYDDRSMPIAASILWKPIDGAAEEGAGLPPIFITQRALAAVHDHCAATRAACFGLLIGDVVNSPETGAPYVVVESTIRLPGSPDEDAKTVLVQGWVVAQDVLRKSGDLLVGWYRGGGGEAALSPAEADAHRAFFVQPWQLAVVVGSGDTTVGGVLRRSEGSGWAQECLPFYELVDPASFRPDGSKPTCLRWDNYRTEETALVPPAALSVPAVSAALDSLPAVGRAASSVQPWAFLPDQFGSGDEGEGRWASHARVGRIARWTAYAAAGVVGVAGLLRLYSAGAAPASRGSDPGSSAAVAATSLEPVDRAADTLALAIAAFDLRAQLFASRQMQCPELARGLILVEERWTTYNSVRKENGAPLDSARTARDGALYTDVDGVERRFERSACPRP